jgi:hypothetical protein
MVQNVIKGCFRRTLGAQSDFGGPTCRRYSIYRYSRCSGLVEKGLAE